VRDKIPNVKANGYGSFRTDMFGRIKVSEPYSLFDSSHRFTENGDFSDMIGMVEDKSLVLQAKNENDKRIGAL